MLIIDDRLMTSEPHAHQAVTCVVLRMPSNPCLCMSVYGMYAVTQYIGLSIFCSQEKNNSTHGSFMWLNYWLNLWVPFMTAVSCLCHDVCNIMWCWTAQFSISITSIPTFVFFIDLGVVSILILIHGFRNQPCHVILDCTIECQQLNDP